MSLKVPLDRLRRSLAARLSLGFALLFAAGFFAVFTLLFISLSRDLEARDYDALQLRLRQYAAIYAESGLPGLQSRVAEDSQAPHVRSLFIRLVGREGSAIWGKVPPDWLETDARRVVAPDGWGGWTNQRVFTMRIPRDDQQDLAIVSETLPNGLLLQVGRSTDSRAVLLGPLKRVFLWIGSGVVVFGFGLGFIATWRATRPLRGVVETARKIIVTGALDARVAPSARDDEIAELVRHFNSVLDKNATLVRSMRDTLDNVAHDLRTPLTRLRGAAEAALRESAAGDLTGSREALAECVEQADDVMQLLRAVMEISESETGMLTLQKVETDLGDVARGAAELYTEVAEANGLTLRCTDQHTAPVLADPVRLREAVANLVDNALKYTPRGGSVDIQVLSREKSAVLQVRDTGPGVPEADQPRVWERLFRGDQSRSKRGLGLGLSLVRAIVRAHGGEATVYNAETGGAVFEITLPLADSPGVARLAAPAAEPAPAVVVAP